MRQQRKYLYRGELFTTEQLCAISGISPCTLWSRINREHMSVEQAMTLRVKQGPKQKAMPIEKCILLSFPASDQGKALVGGA